MQCVPTFSNCPLYIVQYPMLPYPMHNTQSIMHNNPVPTAQYTPCTMHIVQDITQKHPLYQTLCFLGLISIYNHLFAAFVWFSIYIPCTLRQCAGAMVGPLTRPGLATAWSTLLYPKLGTVSVPCHTGHVLPCRPSPTTASLPSTPSSAALQPARTPKGPGPPPPLLFMFFTVCFDVYARTLTICYHFINCAQGPRSQFVDHL